MPNITRFPPYKYDNIYDFIFICLPTLIWRTLAIRRFYWYLLYKLQVSILINYKNLTSNLFMLFKFKIIIYLNYDTYWFLYGIIYLAYLSMKIFMTYQFINIVLNDFYIPTHNFVIERSSVVSKSAVVIIANLPFIIIFYTVQHRTHL